MTEQYIGTIVCDLDDTLIKTSWRFELTHLRACVFAMECAGHGAPYKDSLLTLQEDIDDKIVEAEGFADEYHARALLEFLEEVCVKAKVNVTGEMRAKMREISAYPFDPANYSKTDFIDGAEKTLEFLVSSGANMHLLTRGVKKIQEAKVVNLELYRFFREEQVHIVKKNDKKAMLLKLSDGIDKKNVYVIDDSLAIINLATSLGLYGIWIPQERGCRKRETDFGGIKNKDLTIPLEKIIEINAAHPAYKNWKERVAAKDLPQYILDYELPKCSECKRSY